MAVTSIDLMLDERTAALSEDNETSYQRKYLVTAANSDSEQDVLNAVAVSGLAIGAAHPDDSSAAILGVSINFHERVGGTSQALWIATVNYGPYDPFRHASSPLTLDPLVVIEGENYERVADLDNAGNPVCNTAGDSFDPPVLKDQAKLTIRVTKNYAEFDVSAFFGYSNKVNSDTFWGIAAGYLRVLPPRAALNYHQACGSYWQVEWVFAYNPEGWHKKVLNQGYRQLVSGAWKPILNADGSQIDSPAFLNSSGVALTPPVSSSNIVVLDFPVYDTMSFTSAFPGFTTFPLHA